MHTIPWPTLSFSAIKDTLALLHQYTQIIGKIRYTYAPWQNHCWHCTLHVTAKGFSTQSFPMQGTMVQIDFDLHTHELFIQSSDAPVAVIPLTQQTVASFYAQVMRALKSIGLKVRIYGRPNEMEPAIPFSENTTPYVYQEEAALHIWQALYRTHTVMSHFRSDFVGKASPVHLFWGAFDLAVTRFSGEKAPLHPGGMPNMPLTVMQEAYSKAVSSAGFWFGSPDAPNPIFYAYAYPAAPEFSKQQVQPKAAFYHAELGEFVLPYEEVITAKNPDEALMKFLQSTYEAAAQTGKWNRGALERHYEM